MFRYPKSTMFTDEPEPCRFNPYQPEDEQNRNACHAHVDPKDKESKIKSLTKENYLYRTYGNKEKADHQKWFYQRIG